MQRNVGISTVATTQEASAISVTTHSTIAKRETDKKPSETSTLKSISKCHQANEKIQGQEHYERPENNQSNTWL